MWPLLEDYTWLPLQIALAWFLDLVLGDPQWFPHPVRWIGVVVTGLEKLLRWSRVPLRLAGVVLALVVVAGIYWAVALLLVYSARLHPIAAKALGVVVLYFCFATRCLASEAKRIERLVRSRDLAGARSALALIVGRDTDTLDEQGVCRAVVETVAENTADGVVTPMLYAFVGGPALACAYKAVSTLDSMVGYKNEKYIKLGWASARLDDLFSFVPARVCIVMVWLTAWVLRQRPAAALRVALRDGRKHPSPNAGIPEAAFAGALGVQLGGVSTYAGAPSVKPLLGDPVTPVSVDAIADAVRLLLGSSMWVLVLGAAVSTASNAMLRWVYAG